MNIQTLRENLQRTIAGKEMMLETYKNPSVGRHSVGSRAAMEATVAFLEINIGELKRILQDVEQCEPSLPGEGYNYEKWDGDE